MFGLTQLQILFIVFVLLVGIFAGSWLPGPTGQEATTLSLSPNDPRDLVQKLREHDLHLYYVEDWSGSNVYFTKHPRPIQELLDLPTVPGYIADWNGTVRIARANPRVSVVDTSDWGDFGYQVGNHVVFGDPMPQGATRLIRQASAFRLQPEYSSK